MSHPGVCGYLGGRNPNQRERQAALRRHIDHLPAVDLTWKHQCRCGYTMYSKWRNRWVCRRCARWVSVARIAEVDKGRGA